MLLSATRPLTDQVDPSAVVAASRAPGEPWFCFEQPDRDGAAVAAVGCVTALEGAGPQRFGELADGWRTTIAGAVHDPLAGPPARV